MWHEARKQERMIRGMMVDYRRRAERRKDFYEKIKADPQQFLQLHGRPCKIHLDPAIAAAGDSPAIMMPWQGDTDNLIDRFDVRAHLDHIPEVRAPEVPPQHLSQEERQFNYERYRILAQNTFLGIGEDKFLSQLTIEEQFGVTLDEKEAQREKLNDKKTTGAAIGYNYSNPEANPVPPASTAGPEASAPHESDEDSDLEIIDVDLSIDVNKVEPAQAHELNAVGPLYGLAGCDLFSFLTGDADDAELQKQRAREEKEKAMFSGRKSRRERRAHRDKKLATRVLSPPSYAAPNPNAARQQSHSPSNSRSPSPAPPQAVTFITSFGGDDEDAGGNTTAGVKGKALYADKVKQNLKQAVSYSAAVRKQLKPARRSPAPQTSTYNSRSPVRMGPHRPGSRSLSPSSKSRSRTKSPYRSRSKSPYRSPYRNQSPYRKQSPYRIQSPYRKQSPYRNQSPYRKQSPYRSRSRSRLRYRSRSRSFSRSRSGSYSPRYRRTLSRSRSRTNRSRSHSANHSSDYARHNSRSMSVDSTRTPAGAAPSVPRYYGRRKSDAKSSSEVSLDSDSSDADDANDKSAVGVKPNSGQNQLRLTGSSSKSSSSRRDAGLSLKEKLKRKMQAQLSRQLRADKKAAAERRERESQMQAQRDDEMRELALRMRRRNREQRHQNERHSSDSNSNNSHHSSPTRESPAREGPKNRETKVSRSRSSSAEAVRKIPVWQSQVDCPSTSSESRQAAMRTRPPPFDDNLDHRYDRRERRSDLTNEEYDRGYDQSCRQDEGYSQNYYPNRQNDRYDAHRPYGNRRPYGRGHYHGGPPPNEYSEQEYDDQWEYEGSNYRGRGGRRPYGHYRGYENRRQYQGQSGDSKGYNEYESGGRGYEGAGRGYDGARGSKGAGRGYDQPRGSEGTGRGYEGTGQGHGGARGGYDGGREYEDSRTRPPSNKIRKLVDY